VRLARPYVRYYPDDTTPVQDAYATLRTVGQKATMSRHAGQAAGILINRHAALPGLDPVPAEMRPGASCVLSCVPCGCAHRFCNHKRLFRPSAPSADLG